MSGWNTLSPSNPRVLFKNRMGRAAFCRYLILWPIRRALRNLSRTHIADGRKQLVIFAFDHVSHSINIDGVYEGDYLESLFNWFDSLGIDTKGLVALDIGGNIGNHALFFSERFAKVHTFEPHPRTYKVLSLNADLVDNVTCYNFALSERDGVALLATNPINIGGSSLASTPSAAVQQVGLRRLDGVEGLGKIGLIKIDTEGHELSVVKGGVELIKKNKPIVLFEQCEGDFKNGASDVVTFLREVGYRNFATVTKDPAPRGSFFWKFMTIPVRGLLKGYAINIVLTSRIEPGYYPFIVAIPDWLRI